MYRECSAYLRTLAPVAGVSGGGRWLHPTVWCGMQLLVRAWDVCFWCQSPQMLTLIFIILIFTILDAKWIDLFRGSHSAPVGWPAVRRPERKCAHFCSGWCIVGCLAGALWDGWDWSITIRLFNRSVQIVVWYLWCWDLFYVILVCIRFHVIFVSCDCIMKCIFVWTQVVNKLLLLCPTGR